MYVDLNWQTGFVSLILLVRPVKLELDWPDFFRHTIFMKYFEGKKWCVYDTFKSTETVCNCSFMFIYAFLPFEKQVYFTLNNMLLIKLYYILTWNNFDKILIILVKFTRHIKQVK